MLTRLLSALFQNRVYFYGDFIDPFCYLGFHALGQASRQTIIWRGFELNPDTPTEGGYFLETGANSDLRPGMWASVESFGQRFGLSLKEPLVAPNTFLAHQIIESVPARVKKPLIDRIYQAYFLEQKDIGRPMVLRDIIKAFDISLPLEKIERDQHFAVVLGKRRQEALEFGFTGMPGYVWKGETHFGALPTSHWTGTHSNAKGTTAHV